MYVVGRDCLAGGASAQTYLPGQLSADALNLLFALLHFTVLHPAALHSRV
jgi:hypothetical protein